MGSPLSRTVLGAVEATAAEKQGKLDLADVPLTGETVGANAARRPGNDHAVPGLDVVDTRADLLDDTGALMTYHSGHGQEELHVQVGMAEAGCLDADVDLARSEVL